MEFVEMSKEARELWVPKRIAEKEEISSIDFLKNYVARNVPLVVRGGCQHWKAMDWNRSRFEQIDGMVTVAQSRDGLADCVLPVNGNSYFCLPFESKMTMKQFYSLKDRVGYIQTQNNCLVTEFPELVNDISELEWAKAALQELDATNLWIGNSNAVSSMHRDPYENIYCVVKGSKHFTLCPPTDAPFLYRKKYPTAKFNHDLSIKILSDEPTVPWIPLDPDSENQQYPLFKYATKIKVSLNPGDVLYLPSLWFHKVAQDDDTIAVNFWYDMQFDARYTWSLYQDRLVK